MVRQGQSPGDEGDEAGGAEVSGVGDRLVGLVCAVVEHHGYACTVVSDDELELRRQGQDEHMRIYLTNLRQWVAQEPEDQWPAIVADFVGSVVATDEVGQDDSLDFGDYALVRPLLRVRLYADDFGQDIEVMKRYAAPGLVEVLVIDKPMSLMMVTVELAMQWEVEKDELFRVARENVRADGPLEVESGDYKGVRLCSLGGDTAYVSAHALWLGDYPVTGPHGALFIVPTQGMLHAVPLHRDMLFPAMNLLITVAWRCYEEGPRSITPNVYWWQDGQLWLAGTVTKNDGGLTVSISGEWHSVLMEPEQE